MSTLSPNRLPWSIAVCVNLPHTTTRRSPIAGRWRQPHAPAARASAARGLERDLLSARERVALLASVLQLEARQARERRLTADLLASQQRARPPRPTS